VPAVAACSPPAGRRDACSTGRQTRRSRPRPPAPASSSRSPSPTSWFTYYHWLDDAKAPDFARTVDIHRKPGYDPVELVLDPALTLPKVRIGLTLLKKLMGFRYYMNVVGLDTKVVRGTHGRLPTRDEDGPRPATAWR
jgi:hypothetical protein